jgi:hypothetical protein
MFNFLGDAPQPTQATQSSISQTTNLFGEMEIKSGPDATKSQDPLDMFANFSTPSQPQQTQQQQQPTQQTSSFFTQSTPAPTQPTQPSSDPLAFLTSPTASSGPKVDPVTFLLTTSKPTANLPQRNPGPPLGNGYPQQQMQYGQQFQQPYQQSYPPNMQQPYRPGYPQPSQPFQQQFYPQQNQMQQPYQNQQAYPNQQQQPFFSNTSPVPPQSAFNFKVQAANGTTSARIGSIDLAPTGSTPTAGFGFVNETSGDSFGFVNDMMKS